MISMTKEKKDEKNKINKIKLHKSTSIIVDAITGNQTNDFVGSENEKCYFKVRDCGNNIKMDEHSPNTYFFSSRGEFLSHFDDKSNITLVK